MRLFANKKLFKKIVILLITITLVNALMPLYMVSADADEEFAGALFRPICQFFAGIGDLLVSGLQWIFIGDGEIKTGEIPELKMSTYVIRYSPGVIFSNKVPGLDANFIKPGKERQGEQLAGKATKMPRTYGLNDEELKRVYGFSWDITDDGPIETKSSGGLFGSYKSGVDKANFIYRWDHEDENGNRKTYVLFKQVMDESFGRILTSAFFNNPISKFYMVADLWQTLKNADDWTLYEIDYTIEPTNQVRESTAAELQKVVSKWYKALRMVSLVALLSVLVYVGIRIIISSTGQEKAKYKKMIGDWVAAICILFILNYIMAFTMDIINKIIEVFTSSGLIDGQGADLLMTEIRNNINSQQYSGWTTFTYLILYLVLVIYSIIFTIHYLKRVVYLAFFTMIAPLIAVTYPIDRIKDGQAQAFGTWIKEYTFNAAIPVIHIIIYSALVGSAADLAKSNPLYAVVCISFLIPAEKFFRKLFGFEKATTSGQLGAATGGALIMNAINKMGAKSGKQAAAKAGASAMPRTSGESGYIAPPGGGAPGGAGGAPAGVGAPSGGGVPPTGGSMPSVGKAATSGGTPSGGGMPSATAFGQAINTNYARPKAIKGANKAGWAGLGRRYLNKNTAKKAALLAGRGIAGVTGAALGGTVGLASGIATGDFSNALKYGAAGVGAGFWASNSAIDKTISGVSAVTSFAKSNSDTFVENKWGTDEYNTRNQIKELSNDQEFNKTCKTLGLNGKDKEAAIRMFNNNGITDSDTIKKAMNLQAKTGASQSEVIAAQKIRQQADKDKLKTGEIRASLVSAGLTNSDINRAMSLIDQL